jgi:hypothetical protein
MSLDMDSSNYTIKELLQLFFDDYDDEDIPTDSIIKKALELKAKALEDNNNELYEFIENAKEKLLKHRDEESNETFAYNKELMEVTSRFVNIDSQYKDIIEPNNSNTTNFIFEFTEPLTKVISMHMYSVEIPVSWYAFDSAYGTHVFKINNLAYEITSGNYSPSELFKEINDKIDIDISATIITASGKTNLKNNTPLSIEIIFFDENDPTFNNAKINNNLGWLLGFREARVIIPPGTSATGSSPIDTWGPKYLIMCIDDFNNNQTNKALVGVSKTDNILSIPTITEPVNLIKTQNNPDIFTISQTTTLKTIPTNVLSSYNLINSDKVKKQPPRYTAPVNSNVFAKIPVRKNIWNDKYSLPMVDFSGPLQKNERVYYGPVNITRMKVSLFDDKGNILNLNGMDWAFCLTTKHVYQYNTPL